MKTLFITPLIGIPKSEPPLGLMYIQAVLDGAGYESKILDVYDTYKEAEKVIREYKPDIVGIPCFTTYRASSFELARLVKKVNPEAWVIMGGPHATFNYKQILEKYEDVDIIVMGEGEHTFLQLLDSLRYGTSPENVSGIAYTLDTGDIEISPPRELIKNLDDLPFPSYRDINLKDYAIPCPPTTTTAEIKANLVTSRGCPFGCTFCSTTQFWSRKWRARSPKNVVDEIEWLYNEKGVKFFSFSDDTFTVDKQRVIDICKEIVKRKLKIKWYTETRSDLVSKKMFKWMKRAGCEMIEFGVESGSNKILKNINKMFTREQSLEAVRLAKEAGLKTEVMLIVGCPGETWETIEETKSFLDEAKPDIVIISVLYIFPNTNIYQTAKELGVISDAFWLSSTPTKPFTAEHDLKTLYRMRLSIILHYELSRGWISLIKYVLGQVRKTPGVIVDQLRNLV